MAISMDRKNGYFYLRTKNTVYVLGLHEGKYPVHLYYGKRVKSPVLSSHTQALSFAPYYAAHGYDFLPDVTSVEFPLFGSGDMRATALKLRRLASGAAATHFTYRSARKLAGRCEIQGLPFASADENTQTLELCLEDEVLCCRLYLYYTVFPESDVISRHFVLENRSEGDVSIEKCMSLALDIPRDDLDMISFWGGHKCERNYQRTPVMHGNQRVQSRRGASSHHYNPCLLLCERKATEEHGEAYGFNFIYSGNFLDEVELSLNGTTRVLVGLGAENFTYLLKAGERFSSPEAVMTYSAKGVGQVSRNMHDFVRSHILPRDVFPQRPVVLNSWEAFHFDIDAKLMVDFAKEAVACGMDMLVMDDGWFGARTSDAAGLGDWFENKSRFPSGLAAFVEEVRQTGIKFGIWIEPEMVNPDSALYRAHPEWVLAAPDYEPMLSRKQLVLDMGNPAVRDYLKDAFAKTFDGVAIDYFKWDMNRNFDYAYSTALSPQQQGEAAYRYMLGVYDLFTCFCQRYPNAMIENCSGGGGRFDLGMMKYSTQIWTSDQTRPKNRVYIQYGSSFGYPASVMSCHVAKLAECKNPRWLDYRFRVALQGALGYEFNIMQASDTVKDALRRQVEEYRGYERLIFEGDLYRLLNPFETNGVSAYYYASKDQNELLLSFLQNEGEKKPRSFRLKLTRAEKNASYLDRLSGKTYTGEELRRGLTVCTDKEEQYGIMWHFVKQ
ncbi:MAG: alpha-galactosidase [Clostridia bacterium]|nr:alpha-galactosidase [Clostridia bacterium]